MDIVRNCCRLGDSRRALFKGVFDGLLVPERMLSSPVEPERAIWISSDASIEWMDGE